MDKLRKDTKENTKDIISVRKEQLELGMKNFKQNTETQMVLGSVKNDTHAIKNKMGLYFGSMITLGFVLGLLFGTQVDTWSPFINDIYSTYNAMKRGVH